MKLIFILASALGLFVLYSIGDQIYRYYKYDKKNFSMLLSNQSEQEYVNIQILIDDQIIYQDSIVRHPGYIYGVRIPVSIGRHMIEVKKDSISLCKEPFYAILNRMMVIDYCDDDKIILLSSWKPILVM